MGTLSLLEEYPKEEYIEEGNAVHRRSVVGGCNGTMWLQCFSLKELILKIKHGEVTENMEPPFCTVPCLTPPHPAPRSAVAHLLSVLLLDLGPLWV